MATEDPLVPSSPAALTHDSGAQSTSHNLEINTESARQPPPVDGQPRGLQWALSELTPREQSCIRLSCAESCVNKAVYHLGLLRNRLSSIDRAVKPAGEASEPASNLYDGDARGSPLVERENPSLRQKTALKASVSISKPNEADGGLETAVVDRRTHVGHADSLSLQEGALYVEGFSTGSELRRDEVRKERGKVMGRERKEEGGSLGEEVVMEALELVVRLEEDRQQALELYTVEKEKVAEFGERLDRAAEERLDQLSRVVQEGERMGGRECWLKR